MSMRISDYLGELERQLRARRVPRARLLREVEDHLRDVADELAASGLPRGDAEAQAVARFGAAAAVATRFAEAAASTTAHRAANAAAGALIAYIATFCAFATSASPLVRDFPQGIPSFFGIQLAAVALAVALARSLRWRGETAAPRAELSSLARGLSLSSGALLASALAEAALAIARPAGVVIWAEARWLTIGFAAAATIVTVAALAAARASAQAAAVNAFPTSAPEAPPAAILLDDLRMLGARLPLHVQALHPLRHPWRLTVLVAVMAFTLITTAQVVAGGAAQHASSLAGEAVLGLLEATAIVGSFAIFGRFLGLHDQTDNGVDE